MAKKLAEESKENNLTATKATIMRTMKHREAANRMWQTMKQYLQPQNARGIKHIMVLDVDKIRTGAVKAISYYESEQDKTKIIMVKMLFYIMMEYTNGLEKILPHKRVVLKEEMEKHLQNHHNCHFHQAEKTPFAKEPLKFLIGYNADTQFAKEL
eukprot:2924150-Ditylum_brightwellii.AAC.1